MRNINEPASSELKDDEYVEPLQPVTQADIDKLEKVAWDAHVEHVVIHYRALNEQLRERLREADRAMKLEHQRAIRAEAKFQTPPEPETALQHLRELLDYAQFLPATDMRVVKAGVEAAIAALAAPVTPPPPNDSRARKLSAYAHHRPECGVTARRYMVCHWREGDEVDCTCGLHEVVVEVSAHD